METIAADPARLRLASGEVVALEQTGQSYRLAMAEG